MTKSTKTQRIETEIHKRFFSQTTKHCHILRGNMHSELQKACDLPCYFSAGLAAVPESAAILTTVYGPMVLQSAPCRSDCTQPSGISGPVGTALLQQSNIFLTKSVLFQIIY